MRTVRAIHWHSRSIVQTCNRAVCALWAGAVMASAIDDAPTSSPAWSLRLAACAAVAWAVMLAVGWARQDCDRAPRTSPAGARLVAVVLTAPFALLGAVDLTTRHPVAGATAWAGLGAALQLRSRFSCEDQRPDDGPSVW